MKNYLAKERSQLAQLALVNRWNRLHSVGTKVIVLRDDNGTFEAETVTGAYLFRGHAVIDITGERGPHSLRRVSPAILQHA